MVKILKIFRVIATVDVYSRDLVFCHFPYHIFVSFKCCKYGQVRLSCQTPFYDYGTNSWILKNVLFIKKWKKKLFFVIEIYQA